MSVPNCLASNTIIPLWNGTVKRADQIIKGDQLIGDDGMVRNVLSTITGETIMCDIQQSQGETYTVSQDHLLTLRFRKSIRNIELRHYMESPSSIQDQLTGVRCTHVHWPTQEVSYDPFQFGQWLVGTAPSKIKPLDTIPNHFLVNDKETRIQLLEGILDSGMPLISPSLADDIIFLARSLGFEAFTSDYNGLSKVILPHIYHTPLTDCMTSPSTGWITIYEKGLHPYVGIHIDGERFVLQDFTVTNGFF